jgi:hypothetical protein
MGPPAMKKPPRRLSDHAALIVDFDAAHDPEQALHPRLVTSYCPNYFYSRFDILT